MVWLVSLEVARWQVIIRLGARIEIVLPLFELGEQQLIVLDVLASQPQLFHGLLRGELYLALDLGDLLGKGFRW